jgi:hypothetical protein
LLAITGVVGAAMHRSAHADDAKQASAAAGDLVSIRGVVVGPDDKPVAGADVSVTSGVF